MTTIAAIKKGPVLHVTGLAASQPDDELAAELKAAISDRLTSKEQQEINASIAVVPLCYSDDKKVALVECHSRLPAFLSTLAADPLAEWQVEMDDVDVSFNQHFFSFT
jgi:hypothetical protein